MISPGRGLAMHIFRVPGFRRLCWLLPPVALAARPASARPPVARAACLASAPDPAPEGLTCHGPAVPLPPVCGTKLRDPEISCALPADVEGDLRQADYSVRQRAADLFSWQTFVALDWPARRGARGMPDPTVPINTPGPRVWETWKSTSAAFRERDGQPAPPPLAGPARRGPRGMPDPPVPINPPGPRVWETWKSTSEAFRERDGQPVPP